MDFLTDLVTDLVTTWNKIGEARIATILAVIALLRSMGKEIYQLGSIVWRWKGWGFISRLYRKANTLYRVRKAKSVMLRTLEETSVRIGIREHDNCLRAEPSKSTRDQWNEITPAKPSWLNDHYVAAALESLSKEGKVVKAKRYSFKSWPPKPEYYHFGPIRIGSSACEEADKVEINDRCLAYQFFRYCPKPSRFDSRRVAETISPSKTEIKYTYPLKDAAPQCDLCWEEENRERNIRTLVDNITEYDLADAAPLEITGANRELQQAVSDACIECRCKAEANLVKQLVEQAIDIRQRQVASCAQRLQYEWRQGEKEELAAALKEYIKRQPSISDSARSLT